ncbi:unnamed protein product, partial [Closterium sp. Yama58-4]
HCHHRTPSLHTVCSAALLTWPPGPRGSVVEQYGDVAAVHITHPGHQLDLTRYGDE